MWGVFTIGKSVIGYTDGDFLVYIRQLFGRDDILAFYKVGR
jgi:hypothetical protein